MEQQSVLCNNRKLICLDKDFLKIVNKMELGYVSINLELLNFGDQKLDLSKIDQKF